MPTNYNVQYNIPRVQVQMPGRQNRLTDGNFCISPSMTEPVKFQFGNQDGVPLLLHSFYLQFVVWERDPLESNSISMGQSKVIINKKIVVDNPYVNEAEMILSEDETTLIAKHSAGLRLYWSLFLVNEDGEIFPMQVSNRGGRYGTIHVDLASGMPIAELIRNPTS